MVQEGSVYMQQKQKGGGEMRVCIICNHKTEDFIDIDRDRRVQECPGCGQQFMDGYPLQEQVPVRVKKNQPKEEHPIPSPS